MSVRKEMARPVVFRAGLNPRRFDEGRHLIRFPANQFPTNMVAVAVAPLLLVMV